MEFRLQSLDVELAKRLLDALPGMMKNIVLLTQNVLVMIRTEMLLFC